MDRGQRVVAGEATSITEVDRWRVFAALPVDDAVRSLMVAVGDQLRRRGWSVKWVNPTLAHLTVRFYGDVARSEIVDLGKLLASVASGGAEVQVTVDRLGAFPSPKRPRVIWLGLAGDVDMLGDLAMAVTNATSHIGESDLKPFKPHITLGRVRQAARPPADFADAVASLRFEPVTFSIDRLQLIRSVLSLRGPTYTLVGEWPLSRPVVRAYAHTPEQHEHG